MNISDKERIINKQINYFIIRVIWDSLRGGLGPINVNENKDNIDSMYGTFEVSKFKWDEIVDGTYSKIKEVKLPQLQANKTGIPIKVFTGEERVYLDIGNDAINSMDKQADKYINSRDKPIKNKIRSKVFQYVKEIEPDIKENPTLYYVYYLIKQKRPYISNLKVSSALTQIMGILKAPKVKDFNNIEIPTLKEYLTILKEQEKLVNAVIVYRQNL